MYALILNPDGTAHQVADIDSQIGGAMALNYDTLTGDLFIVSDDGYNGLIARATFNSTETPDIVHMSRPGEMANVNNEGFALSDRCVDGTRPAWFFQDGVASGSLTAVQFACDDQTEDPEPESPGDSEEPGDSEDPGDQGTPGDPETPEGPTDPQTPADPIEIEAPTGDGKASSGGPALPHTGAQVASLAVIGAILALGGGCLVMIRRKDS